MTATLLAAGCSQPPTEAASAATAAVQSAREAGGPDYAPESFGMAEQALTSLETELAAQKEKFVLLRSYESAQKLAAEAQAAGEKAQTDAIAGKEAARVEAAQLLESVQVSLEEVKGLLEKAPRGKGTRAEIEAMQADVAAVEAGLPDIESALVDGSYLDARAKAQAAQEALDRVRSEIEGAMQARSAARR
jgi:hypothetical protein